MFINYNDIVSHQFLLSPFSYSNPTTTEKISKLKTKYDNLMTKLVSFDGYAFDSKDMYSENISGQLVPLIQISNVNELEYNLNNTQSFVYLSPNHLLTKNNYALSQKSVLISLTGGADKGKKISIYFDGNQQYLLNQRVCSYTLKENESEDYLYYFYAMTLSPLFKEQWMGKGGVQKNTGKQEREKLYLPLISDTAQVKYISMLTQSLINKSRIIAEKYRNSSSIINRELYAKQRTIPFSYAPTTLHEILDNGRLDSKTYSKTYKETKFIIENYENGVFYIPTEKIKGGNTPKKRVIAENDTLKYYWVTPTLYSDIGLLSQKHTINCSSSNIFKNCLLLVNRTSKGYDGKYVGMSYFYNKELLGDGQYNQGIYGIFDYPDDELYFLNALINSDLYRILFGQLSLGSKMKEIKTKQISQIPFPVFDPEKKKEIIHCYHNDSVTYDSSECNLDDFLAYDAHFNQNAGIYEIDASTHHIRHLLSVAFDNIFNNIPVNIIF